MTPNPPERTEDARVVVMTAGGPNPAVVINALAARWPNLHVILEDPESKLDITRRRARRFGWPNALGQLATMMAGRLLRPLAARRTAEICRNRNADPVMPERVPVSRVASINDPQCAELVRELRPAVILLVSTRLMTRTTLDKLPCPVLNLHAGVNPAYRGQMGGYWSLALRDAGNFGATVHLVDAGTDTGGTLYEVRTRPEPGDFIATYPLTLTIASLGIVGQAVEDAVHGRLRPMAAEGPSHLRFPPPLWTWLRYGLTRGIW